MELMYSFTLSLFLTIALIPLLIKFAAKLQLLDDPGADRKMHDQVMPRSGGLGIILGAFIPMIVLLPLDAQLRSLFLGSAVIIFFGLMDDRVELNYKWKLFGQALGIIVVMSGGVVIHQFPFMGLDDVPVWLSYPITFMFLLGVINGVNFSDGLDGLAAGTTLIALLLVTILALQSGNQAYALISLTVIGGVLGFLRYNTFPARIFMGDAGSQFLGFITACLAILVTQSETSAFSPVLPILLLGIPIMDILQVVPVRIKKKLPLPGPDKEHFHHQLVKLNFRHYEVVALIYVLQLAMMAGAYFLRFESDWLVAAFYFSYLLVVLLPIYLSNVYGWRIRDIGGIDSFGGVERRSRGLRKIGWIYHYSTPIVEAGLCLFLLAGVLLIGPVASDFSATALLLAAILTVCAFCLRRNFSVVARMACYSASVFVSYLLSQATDIGDSLDYYDIAMLGFGLFLMLAIRMSRREHFRLDTQDLLILLVVVLVPQLPFETLDNYSIGTIALRLAVMMYACEFLLGRGKTGLKLLTVASISSLIIVGIA